MTDLVNNPPHYNNGDIECLDAIEAMLTPEEFRGYCKGNAMKYIWRSELKGANIQDLEKSKFYLKRIIKKLQEM